MAKLGINTGSIPNDGTGDTLLAAALKINQNFDEIYTTLGDGSNLSGVVTSLVGYATEGYVDSSVVGFITSGSLSGYATEGYVDNKVAISTSGLLTPISSGSSLTGIVTSITAGSGILVNQSTGSVTISATGGGGGESYWVSDGIGINTTSNIGIGTTAKFGFSLDTPGPVRVQKGDNTIVISSAGLTIDGEEGREIQLAYNTNPNYILNNIGIGTTNATSKLTVGGGIQLAQNNETIVGTSGTTGEIKRIGGAPFFYDGSAWREFVLSSGTPVSVPADTEWDSVVFRTTFDDDYTDAKFGATPIVVSAGSSIVGATVKIGTGAYRNDGGSGVNYGLTYPYRPEYDFTGSWTFETWIYFDNTAVSNNESIFAITNSSDSSGQLALYWSTDQFSNKSFIWANENGTNQVVYNTSGAAFSSIFNQKWVHIALVRESSNGSLHFYVDGVESSVTYFNTTIDNNILNVSGNQLNIGGTPNSGSLTINGVSINSNSSIDAIYDDLRISAGVGTAGQRYTSVGITTTTTFTPPTTALPTTGTLSSYIQPPADKYGEISLGVSPTWRGTSGVTVSRQASGNYRVSFASSYTNSNDYYVLSQGMDQGFASYVGIARSTTHVDISINRLDNDATIDSGSLSVQIKNHI